MMGNILQQLSEIMMVKPSLRQHMPKWLEQVVQRRAWRAALSRAYAAWISRHWEWVDYSFNEYFLTHQVAPYLIHCQEEGAQPNPAELAAMWAEQFTWFNQALRQRHIASLIPAISELLSCLETELRAYSFRSLAPAQKVARLSAL
jgi:hypothetical protein